MPFGRHAKKVRYLQDVLLDGNVIQRRKGTRNHYAILRVNYREAEDLAASCFTEPSHQNTPQKQGVLVVLQTLHRLEIPQFLRY